ncbi:MAG: hypothetical protein ACYTEQ_16080 [Planctomycetota bacterium]
MKLFSNADDLLWTLVGNCDQVRRDMPLRVRDPIILFDRFGWIVKETLFSEWLEPTKVSTQSKVPEEISLKRCVSDQSNYFLYLFYRRSRNRNQGI